jgi:hypothetical protein
MRWTTLRLRWDGTDMRSDTRPELGACAAGLLADGALRRLLLV